MICGEITALSAKLTVPLTTLLLVGVKVSLTGHTAPDATDPQLCVAVIEGTEEVIVLKSSDALPQFVTFSVLVDEVCAGTRPNATLHALGQNEGAGVAMLIFETKL
jgi:hypothetical protein